MPSIPRSRFTVAVGLIAMFMVPASLRAHPSAKLVWDPVRGVIYYSDLYRVWQIDRSGRRTVAVPDVHTHYLRLDAAGNLYGDDRELLGTDRSRHRVWRLTPEGRMEDVIPWKNGPWVDDYGFVADQNGDLYWASCPGPDGPCVVKRRSGDMIDVAAGGVEFAGPLEHLAEDGRGGILVADGPDIKRITPAGALELVAEGVPEGSEPFSLMGMHAAQDGSLYVAAYEDQTVLRLTGNGRKTVAARSADPWYPTAVLASPEGLWVLEFDERERTRVRFIRPDGRTQVWGPAD